MPYRLNWPIMRRQQLVLNGSKNRVPKVLSRTISVTRAGVLTVYRESNERGAQTFYC